MASFMKASKAALSIYEAGVDDRTDAWMETQHASPHQHTILQIVPLGRSPELLQTKYNWN